MSAIHRMDTGLRIISYFAALVLIAMGLGLGGLELAGVDTTGPDSEMGPLGVAVHSTLLSGTGVVAAYGTARTRLVLSPEGIEYRTLGYSLSSPWADVVAIGPARFRRGKTVESLLLREPTVHIHSILATLVRFYAPKDAIPLEGLFGSPHYGPLSRDLRRYAPHLFGGGEPDDARTTDG